MSRIREQGRVECLGEDGKVLASILVHDFMPTCDGDLDDAPTIEQLPCIRGRPQELRAMSLSMVDQYRRISKR